MSGRGLWSTALRLLVTCGVLPAVLCIAPGCTDPEVGSVPKIKGSKADVMRGIEGPERTGKKGAKIE